MQRLGGVVAMLVAVGLLVGCAGGPGPEPTATSTAESTPAALPDFNQELHDELVVMLERDQSERTGGPIEEGDQARTDRLKEIVEEFGWPTFALVGEDGEDAAWAIAQHSDLDPAFQKQALELIRAAVEIGQASPGNLAYLEDRIAVAAGDPQVYGTQIGCGPDGPVPATPIEDEAGVDERRAEAGLEPLADYLAEMVTICAEIAG